MEGAPIFPEHSPDDDVEEKDKDKPKKPFLFELTKETKEPDKPRWLELYKRPDDKVEEKPKEVAEEESLEEPVEQPATTEIVAAETLAADKDAETQTIPPLESLAEDEKRHVAQEIVKAHTNEAEQELTPSSEATPEQVESLATITYLNRLEEKLDDGAPADEATLDAVVEETAAELAIELPLPEITETTPTEIAAEEPRTEEEPEEVAEEVAAEEPLGAETIEPDDEAEPDDTTTSAARTSSTPPTSPPTPSSPPPPYSPYAGGGPGAPSPPPSTDSLRAGMPPMLGETVEGPSPRSTFLVGGIIGYLIGRRRGRIKTERELLPIQHKLEQQVHDLQGQIAEREAKIRHATREQLAAKPAAKEQILERLEKHRQKKQEKQHAQEFHQPTSEQAPPAIEKRPERLGRFIVAGERPREATKPVAAMTIPELVALASTIRIENTTLDKLYESNRLNEEGLRRATQAYVRGERYEHIVHNHLLSPERNPEILNRAEQQDEQRSYRPEAPALPGVQVFTRAAENTTIPTAERQNHFAHAQRETIYSQAERDKAKTRVLQAGLVVTVIIAAIVFTLLLLS